MVAVATLGAAIAAAALLARAANLGGYIRHSEIAATGVERDQRSEIVFLATSELSMAGNWRLTVEWTGPSGPGSVTFLPLVH